jgi:hypothetical protein
LFSISGTSTSKRSALDIVVVQPVPSPVLHPPQLAPLIVQPSLQLVSVEVWRKRPSASTISP